MHNFPVLRAGLASALALVCHLPVLAQMPDVSNTHELERAGFVHMDEITTPLLYPAATRKPFNPALLLQQGREQLPNDLRKHVHQLGDSNEFKVHEALRLFQPYLDEQLELVRNAGGYTVRLAAELGKYDFERRRFPLALGLSVPKRDSAESYHCPGAYDKFGGTLLAACISASNWNKKNNAFQYLAIDDERQAARIKARIEQKKAGFFFLMRPDGKFRLVENNKMRFGRIFSPTLVSGVQPARVVGLVLIDFESSEILVGGPMPGESPDAAPLPAPASGAAGGVPAGTPNARPAPVAILGRPANAVTRDLDKLLATLSHTIYSDDGKIVDARQRIQQFDEKTERIANDPGRAAPIRARELQDLAQALAAAENGLARLQEQLRL